MEIKFSKFTKQFSGHYIIGTSRLNLIAKGADVYWTIVKADCSLPFLHATMPVNSLKTRRRSSVGISVKMILLISADPEVALSIIKVIMIYMIRMARICRFQAENFTVHHQSLGFSIFGVKMDSIKNFTAFANMPFEFNKMLIVGVVNNGELGLA